MFDVMKRPRRGDDGFTLIELLVVIVIIGILAAIVVFAVGGITDKGQDSACTADKRSLQTAEEAYFAQPSLGDGTYGTEQDLVDGQLLAELSTMHDIGPNPGASYSIVDVGKCA